MANKGHPGPMPVRQQPTVNVPDSEIDAPTKYTLIALARIHRSLAGLSRYFVDLSKAVDEYGIVSDYTPANEAIVEVLPTFDTINERIESVIITGPVTTAFNLQLGDRFWSLSTDATGKVVIAPVAILLSRNDRRILTSATAGNWNVELMGHADERF